ncbi:MAG TPA: glycosyltransferase [Solirubrobacteraceae bacterium]|nr:glycosyltransferase [Solirubrobacteraceae bacterium]
MQILTVGNRYPPWSLGGYETTWAATVAALRAAGHPTDVLTTRPDPTDLPSDGAPDTGVARELSWYWHAHRFPRRSLRECVALERANAAVLAATLRARRPDGVLWFAMGGMSLSLLEQVRRAGVPAVAAVADDWPGYGPGVDGWSVRWRGPAGRLAAPMAERLSGVPARLDLDRAARWTFISAHTLAAARAAGWRLPGAVVHHPGVDPERFAPSPAPPWSWRLLYCGRIDPRKGIDTAVRALTELPEAATLVIDGHGDAAHAGELRALAGELGLGDRVRLTKSDRADVPAAMAACDALVFPVTWEEPWGLVPLEAMATGRPVVAASSGGGAAEYLEPGRNCLAFAPGDAAGLAGAVRRLSEDEELRAGLVRGGAATAGRLSERAFIEGLVAELQGAVAAGAIR